MSWSRQRGWRVSATSERTAVGVEQFRVVPHDRCGADGGEGDAGVVGLDQAHHATADEAGMPCLAGEFVVSDDDQSEAGGLRGNAVVPGTDVAEAVVESVQVLPVVRREAQRGCYVTFVTRR
ncbi:hypothetical protein Ahu01nite_000140 [Winogradskya humida]|uniref:Uncharacterized protein n=1 Tax=Winogradskya humida TaxID=113566 RepID=A0ABQ3ZF66_9ACTN|nr:hypothetical protein Ahu01nite_000140 [Actinoplanes humidus]